MTRGVTPKLTFAVPFYRSTDYLRRAVDSVLAQSIDRWQLVVVDDAGPAPEAADLVRDYADPRITYKRNPHNLGLAGNWNRCLELADTELVTLLHADDELLPEYARTVVDLHRKYPEAAAVYTGVRVIDRNSRPVFSFPDLVKRAIEQRSDDPVLVAGEAGLARLMRGQFIFCPSLCYRARLIGTAPFLNRWRMVLDLALLSELLLADHTLVGAPEVAYAYRRHAGSQSAKLTESAERFAEELLIFDEIALRATDRSWHRAAAVARRKRIVKLHLAYRVCGDVFAGRGSQARAKLALLRRS